MSDTLTLVSTTDSPEEVQSALTGTPVPPKADPPPAGEATPPATPPPAGETPPVTPPAGETPPPDGGAEPPPANETPEQRTARERRMDKIQRDIDTLWKQKQDLRRDVESEETRLRTLQQELTALAAKGLVAPPADKPAEAKPEPAIKVEPDRPQPQLADVNAEGKPKYANYEEWVADLGLWNAELAEKRADARLEARLKADRAERDKQAAEERERIERDSATRAATEHLAKHQTAIEEFKKTHADFDAALLEVSDLVGEMKRDYAAATGRPGELMFEILDKFTLEDATNSAALVYHLAKHPDEMRQIVQLPPARQLIALGRLDSRLEGAVPPQPGPSTKVPPTTKAPDPIKPVGGGPTAPSTVDPDKESYSEYKARRDREERARLGLPAR